MKPTTKTTTACIFIELEEHAVADYLKATMPPKGRGAGMITDERKAIAALFGLSADTLCSKVCSVYKHIGDFCGNLKILHKAIIKTCRDNGLIATRVSKMKWKIVRRYAVSHTTKKKEPLHTERRASHLANIAKVLAWIEREQKRSWKDWINEPANTRRSHMFIARNEALREAGSKLRKAIENDK